MCTTPVGLAGFDRLFGSGRSSNETRCGVCGGDPCVCQHLQDWPLVRARCHSDDFEHETSFIASSWFTQASDSEILALAATNWEHAYEADAVARHCEDDEPDLIALFKYTDNNDMGFECEVDAASASAWVRTHRPHLDLTSGQRP